MVVYIHSFFTCHLDSLVYDPLELEAKRAELDKEIEIYLKELGLVE